LAGLCPDPLEKLKAFPKLLDVGAGQLKIRIKESLRGKRGKGKVDGGTTVIRQGTRY